MRLTHCLPMPLLLAFGACAVGPDYRGPPAVVAAPEWVTPAPAAPAEEAWWLTFGDPVLTKLIEEATRGSLDIRAALARLAEARANRDVTASAGLPKLSASASASTNRLSENGQIPIGRIPGFARDFDLFDAGFDASWELDLWGRTRRSVQGATALVAAAEADRRGVVISLRAEVARSYIELRAAQLRLASLQADTDAQDKIAALTRQRFDAGEAARFDFDRASGLALATAAQLPGLRGDIAAAAYRLALLTGKPPESIDAGLLEVASIPQPADGIAIGLRSELLRRRPDIIAAERRLAAATADVGVATADLFPRISLVGSIGQQAQSVGDLGQGASMLYSLGPHLSWPIFDRGRLHAVVHAAGARSDGAAIGYESAVLEALSDSETAANRYARASEALAQSDAALQAQRSALALARQRYEAGEADLIELLTAESGYATSQRATTDAEAARALQAIALFKALGCGTM